MLVMCNPHNPVGRAWTRQELARRGAICRAHGVLGVADEIQGDITFPGHAYTPFVSVSDTEPEGTFLVWLDLRKPGLATGDLAAFLRGKAGRSVTRGIALGAQGAGFARLNVACTRARPTRARRAGGRPRRGPSRRRSGAPVTACPVYRPVLHKARAQTGGRQCGESW